MRHCVQTDMINLFVANEKQVECGSRWEEEFPTVSGDESTICLVHGAKNVFWRAPVHKWRWGERATKWNNPTKYSAPSAHSIVPVKDLALLWQKSDAFHGRHHVLHFLCKMAAKVMNNMVTTGGTPAPKGVLKP